MPNKLFISYRSSDAPMVDKIARDLSLLRNPDGSTRYIPWQDKHNLPPASPNWWNAIVEAIEASHLFVFNLSAASLQSEVCKAELDYARALNLPMIILALPDAFILNPQSGKYDLPRTTWELVPEWIKQRQLMFYIGADYYRQFDEAVANFERRWPPRYPATPPLQPGSNGNPHALYAAAGDSQ
jgi:hypothetical protein